MSPKRWDLESAALRVKQLPQPFAPSLTGPTAIRKIFKKQDDALKFAKEFGEDLLVFSYESNTLGQAGQRLFLVSGVESFFHYYQQMSPSGRCHYEVIPPDRPCKLYLDLEFYVKENPDRDGYLSATVFIQAVRLALQFFYGGSVNSEDILILDASTSKKFSQHVIFDADNHIFVSNLEQDQLIRIVSRALYCLQSCCTNGMHGLQSTNAKLCPMCEGLVQRLVSESLTHDEFIKCNVGQCYVCPRSTASSKDIVNATHCDQFVSVCDLGVYTRNRNFRLAGSRKLGHKDGVLLPPGVHPDKSSIISIWTTCDKWAKTLATYLQNTPSRLLHRPQPECTCDQNKSSNVYQQIKLHSLTDPILETTGGFENQLSPELKHFVDTIVHNWIEKSSTRDMAISPPTMAGAHHRWRIRFFTCQMFTISADKLHYCERIGRAHQSNHILLVFDLVHGCFYQKCMDPDCQADGYRSPSWPIPPDCLPSSLNNSVDVTPCGFERSAPLTDDDLLLSGCLDLLEFQQALLSEEDKPGETLEQFTDQAQAITSTGWWCEEK